MSTVHVSFFAAVARPSVVESADLTWPQLTSLLHTHTVTPEKTGVRLFNFCRFSTTYRADANVLEVTALLLDLDDQPLDTVRALAAKLAPFQHLGYSTHRHGEREGAFRLRVAVALSRPVLRAEWPTFAAGVKAWLGDGLDDCLVVPSQSYYLPSHPPGRTPLTFAQPGASVDVHDLLARTPPVEASSRPVADVWRPETRFSLDHLRRLPGDVPARLLRGEKLAPEGERHHTRVALVYQFLTTYGPGEPDAQLLHLLVSSADAPIDTWVREFQSSRARAKAEAQHALNLQEEKLAQAADARMLAMLDHVKAEAQARVTQAAVAVAHAQAEVFTSAEVKEIAKKAKDPVIKRILTEVFKGGGLEPDYLQAAPAAGAWLAKRTGKDPGVLKRAFLGTVKADQDAIWAGIDIGAAQARDKEAWRRALIVGDNDKPSAGEVNVRTILQLHPETQGQLWMDVRATKVRVGSVPWDRSTTDPFWNDADAGGCALWIGQELGVAISFRTVWEALGALKPVLPQIDPVVNYLNCLTWDMQPRLSTWLARFAGTEDTTYTQSVARASLIAAVARAYQPGCKADQVPILEGGQGAMKTTLIRALVPYAEWFNTTTSKLALDNVRLLQKMSSGPWVIELGELAGLKRSEQEETKAFLSEQTDTFRAPYARDPISCPRRVVFFGTANGDDYLQDHTGNRRWLPLEVGACDPSGLTAVRDQLWAEAVTAYRNGEQWWVDLTPEVKAQQAARVEYDPLDDEIAEFLEGRSEVCFAQIAALLGEKPGDKRLALRVKNTMRRWGWEKTGRKRQPAFFPFGPGLIGGVDRIVNSCFWERPKG